MGWASLLAQSAQNPFTSFLADNANAIRGVGVGLGRGPDINTGLGYGAQYAAQGAQRDDELAAIRQEDQKRLEEMNKTVSWLRQNAPDYAGAVEAGVMSPTDAYTAYLQKQQPPAPTKLEFRDVNGDIIGFDPYTGKSQTVYDGEPAKPNAPSGYQYGADGNLSFIPGGPADPANKRQPMPSATLQKEIFQTDEAIQAGQNVLSSLDTALKLNDVAWDGPLADSRSAVASLTGNSGAVATQTLKNIVTSNALESLKAIFGAMPTEGERKILLEVQGSVDQPRAVRKAIFDRAKAAAERRIEFNKKKASGLRSGQYFDEGFSPVDGMGNANVGPGWEVVGAE